MENLCVANSSVSAIAATPDKVYIGGYFTIEAKDDAEAEAIAKECPHLWNGTNWIELRPVDSMTVAEAKAG